MRRIMLGMIVSSTLLCNPVAHATWYASVANDKVVDCKYFSESLDQSWQALSKKFGPCSLKMGTAAMVSGYVFHCGPDNAQLLFRTKDDCDVIRRQVNEGAKATPEAFAPKGTKNPTGWVVAIDGCLSKAVTDSSIAKMGLQKLNDYCVCTANDVSMYTETELASDKTKTARVIASAMKRCSNNLGIAMNAERETRIREYADTRLKGLDAPKPTKNSIQLTKDLFVYDNWFFVTSKNDFDQMINFRSEAQTVRIGQRFGFKALFRSIQKKTKLRVELRVPERAENFPVRAGTVKVSDDHKMVTVDQEIDPSRGSIAYYWGLGEGDPLGTYQLSYSLDGVPVKTYSFDVKPESLPGE